MRRTMKLIVVILFGVAMLSGCSKTTENTTDTTQNNNVATGGSFAADDISITYNDTVLKPNTLYDETMISEEYEYYEAQSCGFDGLDKIYTYNTIEIYTYPQGSQDYILEILLLENGKTDKGITNGSTKDEIIAAYGEATTATPDKLSYDADDMSLIFALSSNQKVEEIRYVYNY